MNTNLTVVGIVVVAAGLLLDRIDLSGNSARLASIVSKLLKTIGLVITIGGLVAA